MKKVVSKKTKTKKKARNKSQKQLEYFKDWAGWKKILIAGLVLISALALGWLLGKKVWEKGIVKADWMVMREQQETLGGVEAILKEINQLTSELEGKLIELEEDRSLARSGRKMLTMEERRQWLELLGRLDDASFHLMQECEAYDNDVSVQAYPFRDFYVDFKVGRISYLEVPVNELIRRGEIMAMGDVVTEEQLQLIRDALEREKRHEEEDLKFF